jgi:predicted amidohydrolase YtcJ
MKLASAFCTLLSVLLLGCDAPGTGTAVLIENVRGYTVSADSLVRFDAIVIDSGRVLARGTARTLRDEYPSATIRDGKGQALLPGFIDAHGHVLGLGREAQRVQLEGCRSLSELQQRLRAFAAAHPATDTTRPQWILGRGWNQELWPTRAFPTAADLDSAVSDRPVWLERVDGHAAVGNTLALKLAGIIPATLPPIGGAILRDVRGFPTGVFVDNATSLVERVIPTPTDAEDSLALVSAMRRARQFGLTSVHDAGISQAQWRLYQRTARAGHLTLRIWAMAGQSMPGYDSLLATGPVPSLYGDMLALRAVKLYTDGALGSRGAALLEPYSDKPDSRGLLFRTPQELQTIVNAAALRGFVVCAHAIGDAANRQCLDAFAALVKLDPRQRERRHRIEHAQVVAPADFQRFADLGIVASMQPTHATSDKNMAEARIGATRLKGAYAWRTMLDHRVMFAAGSDFPVESANPLLGWYAAVTRQDTLGLPPGGWQPSQALTLVEGLRAFTRDAARAAGQENVLGSLDPGKWADFVILDTDPFATSPDGLWRIKVRETWVAGKRVYPE